MLIAATFKLAHDNETTGQRKQSAVKMALTGTNVEAIRTETTLPGWSFQMRDENGTGIHVLVTDLALENIDSGGSSLAVFQTHRSEIERLASEKHASGRIEKDGTVRITSPDVIAARHSS
jgi:hypothetical protein